MSKTEIASTNPSTNQSMLLAEVNLFRQAFREDDGHALNHAREYSYWNNRTALLEAVSKRGVSLTRQDYHPSEGRFYAFGRPIAAILAEGVRAVLPQAQTGDGYNVEFSRRQLELREEQFLEEIAQSGGLDQQLMLTISPYPEEMPDEVASSLGYDPATRAGKLRIHHFDRDHLRKETAEIFFTESSLPKIRAIAKALGKEELFRSLDSPSAALGQPIFLDKSLFPDYLAVLNELSSTLYDNPKVGEQIVIDSRRILKRAEPLIVGLVNLDEELALSLTRGAATPSIKEVLNNYLDKFWQGSINFSESDYLALTDGLGHFSEKTAEVLKKIALINTYVQIDGVVKQPKNKAELSLFDNEEAIMQAMAMGEANISYCGMSLNSPYGAYGWGAEVTWGVLFGSAQGNMMAANEMHITRCPSCGQEWLVSEAVHGKQGIRCSCGNSVEGGTGALCIVKAAKLAGGIDRIMFAEAETDTCD
jgi:hypothetical protein